MDKRELFMHGRNLERSFIAKDPFPICGIALEGAQIHTTAITCDGCHTAALGPCNFPGIVSSEERYLQTTMDLTGSNRTRLAHRDAVRAS